MVRTQLLLPVRQRSLNHEPRRRPESQVYHLQRCPGQPAGGAGWTRHSWRVFPIELDQIQLCIRETSFLCLISGLYRLLGYRVERDTPRIILSGKRQRPTLDTGDGLGGMRMRLWSLQLAAAYFLSGSPSWRVEGSVERAEACAWVVEGAWAIVYSHDTRIVQ